MLFVRPSVETDLAAITAIYAIEVLDGSASFELVPPTPEEMANRRAAVLAAGLPWLVAEVDGRIAGYAYAGVYRARPGYRYTVENSVYVGRDVRRCGAGRALLAAVIAGCAAAGKREVIAIIGDSGNAASIGLHGALGFRHVGTLTNVGFKFGRWLDSVIMQRSLAAGSEPRPGPGSGA